MGRFRSSSWIGRRLIQLLALISVAMITLMIASRTLFHSNLEAGKHQPPMKMRKLLQSQVLPSLNDIILSPLVPINWWIFGDAPLLEWNIDDPIASYWLTFTSNLASTEAVAINLFGDFPVAGFMMPNLDLFGGRGLNPLDFEGIEAGGIIAQLSAWFEFEFFDFAGNLPLARIDIWDKFGFEDLGLPEDFANHYSLPWDGDGVVKFTVIEDSFVSWLRKLDLRSWVLNNLSSYGGYSGFDFSSI